jgi:hypothetical protein
MKIMDVVGVTLQCHNTKLLSHVMLCTKIISLKRKFKETMSTIISCHGYFSKVRYQWVIK